MINIESLIYFLGMSESSGPHTVCKMAPNRWNAATAGKNMDGVETKIFDPDVDGEGEVCINMVIECSDF